MKLLVDMNLSPSWIPVLENAGHTAKHWSSMGAFTAPDREIMKWARQNGYTVFTHDLDFGAILAATNADSPSVIQIRTQEPTPLHCAELITEVLGRYAEQLSMGALISIDEYRTRIRVLPLKQQKG